MGRPPENRTLLRVSVPRDLYDMIHELSKHYGIPMKDIVVKALAPVIEYWYAYRPTVLEHPLKTGDYKCPPPREHTKEENRAENLIEILALLTGKNKGEVLDWIG